MCDGRKKPGCPPARAPAWRGFGSQENLSVLLTAKSRKKLRQTRFAQTVPSLLSNAFSKALRFLGFLQMRHAGARAGGQPGFFLISLCFYV